MADQYRTVLSWMSFKCLRFQYGRGGEGSSNVNFPRCGSLIVCDGTLFSLSSAQLYSLRSDKILASFLLIATACWAFQPRQPHGAIFSFVLALTSELVQNVRGGGNPLILASYQTSTHLDSSECISSWRAPDKELHGTQSGWSQHLSPPKQT